MKTNLCILETTLYFEYREKTMGPEPAYSKLQRGPGEEAVPGLNDGDARTPESPHPDHWGWGLSSSLLESFIFSNRTKGRKLNVSRICPIKFFLDQTWQIKLFA